MLIGKAGEAKSAIATADSTSVTVRGKDLASELMGVMPFTELFIFHLTGKEGTKDQVFFLDALLVAITEHGLTPSVQASRMTLAAEPDVSCHVVLDVGAVDVAAGAEEAPGPGVPLDPGTQEQEEQEREEHEAPSAAHGCWVLLWKADYSSYQYSTFNSTL